MRVCVQFDSLLMPSIYIQFLFKKLISPFALYHSIFIIHYFRWCVFDYFKTRRGELNNAISHKYIYHRSVGRSLGIVTIKHECVCVCVCMQSNARTYLDTSRSVGRSIGQPDKK